jgi:hypothetical protein
MVKITQKNKNKNKFKQILAIKLSKNVEERLVLIPQKIDSLKQHITLNTNLMKPFIN